MSGKNITIFVIVYWDKSLKFVSPSLAHDFYNSWVLSLSLSHMHSHTHAHKSSKYEWEVNVKKNMVND